MRVTPRPAFCLSVLLLAAWPEFATAKDQAVSLYSQADLQQMPGQSALDIIGHVAGFQFVNSNSQRGLSNAAGNVLINGLVVMNKAQSLDEVLSGIAIGQISAMQVYLAGHPFNAVSQHTQVINVQLDTAAQPVNWKIAAMSHAGAQLPAALSLQSNVQWLGVVHQWQLRAEKALWQSDSGYSEQTPAGQTYLTGNERYRENYNDASIGVVSAKTAPGKQWQFSSQFMRQRQQERYLQHWSEAGQHNSGQLHNQNNLNQLELALDWQQQLDSGWQWQSNALLRRGHKAHQSVHGSMVSGQPYIQKKRATEQALKISASEPALAWQPEVGLELSYNRLSANTDNGQSQYSSVNEIRAEPYFASKVRLASQWQLYSRLTAEQSRLQSHSAERYQSSNFYVKPLLKLSHYGAGGLNSTYTAQVKIEQLDFDDFMPSQDAYYDRQQAGNAQLKPQHIAELRYEASYDAANSWTANVQLHWQKIRDTHEYVQFADASWGIANAGSSTVTGADIKLNLDTGWISDDSELIAAYEFRDTRFGDPLTGQRSLSWMPRHVAEVEFRQTAADYAWGLVVNLAERESAFYPDEVYHEQQREAVRVYLEYTLANGIKLELEADDVFGRERRYQRDVYASDRSGALAYRYFSQEKNGASLQLTLSGAF